MLHTCLPDFLFYTTYHNCCDFHLFSVVEFQYRIFNRYFIYYAKRWYHTYIKKSETKNECKIKEIASLVDFLNYLIPIYRLVRVYHNISFILLVNVMPVSAKINFSSMCTTQSSIFIIKVNRKIQSRQKVGSQP